MADDTWTRYQLKQKLFSIGEDFWIENERGEAVYRVDGKALTLRETFVLEDRGGSELATVQAKLLAFMPTMTIQRGGQAYATVKKVPFTFLHQEYTIEVQGAGILDAKGDFTDHEYEIRAGDQPVAAISRQWFSLRDTYGIAIAPARMRFSSSPRQSASTKCPRTSARNGRERRAWATSLAFASSADGRRPRFGSRRRSTGPRVRS